MKLVLYVLTVFFTLGAVRETNNTQNDILPAIILVGMAILCFWAAQVVARVKENKKL